MVASEMSKSLSLFLAVVLAVAGCTSLDAQHRRHNQPASQAQNQPWMQPGLSPDERADMVLKQLTVDEKIDLLHGNGIPGWGTPRANAYLGNGGGGFSLGPPRPGSPLLPMGAPPPAGGSEAAVVC